MENYTYSDALTYVDQQSPASSDADKKALAKRLLALMQEHEETAERIWLLYM